MSSLVLVTGAAGRLGRGVLAAYADVGIPTRALVLERDFAGELPTDQVVIGDARDVLAVSEAVAGVTAVVHLAAIPSPSGGTAEEVFCGNTAATFNVLEAAARVGVEHAVIASSHAATGLPFAPSVRTPAYLPIDEHLPLQVEDPYGLSKQVDELTAGHDVVAAWTQRCRVALSFSSATPTTACRAGRNSSRPDPAKGAAELWGYLDYRDAAECCVAALARRRPGCHVVTVAAPTTLAPYPTEQLLDAFLPNVPRRTPFPGRTAPFDVTRARELFDFSPRFEWPLDERDLPDELDLPATTT